MSAGLQNNVKGHREKLMPVPQIPGLNSHVWLSPSFLTLFSLLLSFLPFLCKQYVSLPPVPQCVSSEHFVHSFSMTVKVRTSALI